MEIKFVCGMVEIGKGAEPDWVEVAARLRMLQKLREETARFKFMGAVQDDCGVWRVPFLASLRIPYDVLKGAIEEVTPYDATRVVPLRVARMPADRLSELSDLADGRPPFVKAADLIGRSGRVPNSEVGDEKDVFSGLVGMEEQRLMLMKLGTAVAKHGRGAVDCLHLVFVGNPGTGKTELASRLVTYLDRIGVTDGTHRMVRVGGNDLMGEYTGQTAPRVKKFVESARGGMLFIDEFYSLSAAANNYGREAIDTLTEQVAILEGLLPKQISGDELIDRIYTRPFPNRFCAQYSRFVGKNLHTDPYFHQLVADSFRDFFRNIVSHYPDYRSYRFNCVGSVGYAYRDLLRPLGLGLEEKLQPDYAQYQQGRTQQHHEVDEIEYHPYPVALLPCMCRRVRHHSLHCQVVASFSLVVRCGAWLKAVWWPVFRVRSPGNPVLPVSVRPWSAFRLSRPHRSAARFRFRALRGPPCSPPPSPSCSP